jgi:hypothetical protein
VERQADRIVGISPLTEGVLCSLAEEDIPMRADLASIGIS